MVCCSPGAEPTIALQVERDALKEMTEVVDPKTAPLEELQLRVQSFYKATTLSVAKVVCYQAQPIVHQREERRKTIISVV